MSTCTVLNFKANKEGRSITLTEPYRKLVSTFRKAKFDNKFAVSFPPNFKLVLFVNRLDI